MEEVLQATVQMLSTLYLTQVRTWQVQRPLRAAMSVKMTWPGTARPDMHNICQRLQQAANKEKRCWAGLTPARAAQSCQGDSLAAHHSSFSMLVRGMLSSIMVVKTSTNGTPMMAALKRSGRMLSTAPMVSPPAERPFKCTHS